MNVQELGYRWGVHYNTIYTLIRSGALKPDRRKNSSQAINVNMGEVLRFEEERGVSPDSMNTDEVSDLLCCSRDIVNKYVDFGYLTVGRLTKNGKRYFNREEVLEVWEKVQEGLI